MLMTSLAVVLNSNALSVFDLLAQINNLIYCSCHFSCVFKDDPDPSRNDQITRAASLVRSTLAFAQVIYKDQLPTDKTRTASLCMNQYWWLFGVSRVPGEDGGRIRHQPDSRHITVLCRGQFYRLDVLEEGTGRVINEDNLVKGLQFIVGDAYSIPVHQTSKTAIGLLTTGNQKLWARCRTALIHDGLLNGYTLGAIDSSLFALCLDDSEPQSPAEICKNMICGTIATENDAQVGTCINRWYDKLALIVCRNGKAGMNFEHTCTDGSVDIRMACDIYMGSISQPKPATNGDLPSSNGPTADYAASKPQKLRWDVDSGIEAELRTAEAQLVTRIKNHQLETLDFTEYGKSFMTSMGFSPDAFFQMVLQAAYCSMEGRTVNGFEPVQMRQYLHGRTDVVRTTTPEAKMFAHTFCSKDSSALEKVDAMHRAVNRHVAFCKSVAVGEGHHRHLFVLHQMWLRRRAFLEASATFNPSRSNGHVEDVQSPLSAPTTTIFTDPGWNRLGTTILMGSNVENPCLAYAGFGPPSDQAFTVCYFMRADHLVMSVCCRNGKARQFVEAIGNTLVEIKTTLEGVRARLEKKQSA